MYLYSIIGPFITGRCMLLLSPSPNLQISSVEKKPLFAPRLLMQILSACWWSLSENIGLTRRPHPSLSRATSINHSQSLSLTDAHPVDTIASLFLSRLRPPGRDEPRTPRDVRGLDLHPQPMFWSRHRPLPVTGGSGLSWLSGEIAGGAIVYSLCCTYEWLIVSSCLCGQLASRHVSL